MNQDDSTCIILPGECIDLPDVEDMDNIKISQQFQITDDYQLKSNQAGHLFCKQVKKQMLYAIQTDPKKYIPELDDYVIGTIKQKQQENYYLDIGSIGDVLLNFYDFEGATKKNRPNLEIGNLVYGRISEISKYMKTKISCISKKSKKEWMTGEAFFGELKNGTTFECSQKMCKRLIDDDPFILKELQKYVTFEICVGVNGKIWIESPDIKNTIIIINSLKKCESMNNTQIQNYLKSISTFFNA